MKKPNRILVAVVFLTVLLGAVALAGASSFSSDDFNGYVLKRPLWTWYDPLGGSSLALSGVNSGNAFLSMRVSGGAEHDIYTSGYNGARILQACTDTSFRIETKFLSLVRPTGEPRVAFDEQGIVLEQDANNVIRVDFVSGDQDSMLLVAIVYTGGFSSPQTKIFKNVGTYANQPTYLRVQRSGSTWTVTYSFDGTSFLTGGSFTQSFNLTKIGPWVGNAGSEPRTWTSVIDYFMNLDSPISPEDGGAVVADNKAPYIHNIQTVPAPNGILLTWNTDAQADGSVDYGPTTSYGENTQHSDLRYDHFATLGGLNPTTLYHFNVSGKTASGPIGTSGDKTASTIAYPGTDATSYSDDFNGATLDASLWTVMNPRGDATFTHSNNRLTIGVPGGVPHDIYGANTAPRILQAVNNRDMQISARFLSGVSNVGPSYQIQGIVFEQDSLNQLRVDFSNSGTGTQLLAIGFINGLNNAVPYLGGDVAGFGAAPMHVRVSRSGAYWLVDYSSNGTSWSNLGTFYHVMDVKKVGVWAGNEGGSPPAFTSQVDWFRAALPARPALVFPANGATSVLLQPTLVWDTTSAAASYRLQVANDTAFTSVIVDDSSITVPNKAMVSLANATKYFWRVRGKNSLGMGKFSLISSFTTAVQAPLAPALLSPADNSTEQDTASILRWSKSTGATSYRLQVATDAAFTSGMFLNDSTVTDTTKQLHGLALNTKYYWRVSAKNSGGVSAYSSVRNFTTITGVPAAPALLSPAAGAPDQPTSLTLRWSRTIPVAITYRLQVSTDPAFASGFVVDDSTLTDTTRAVSGLSNSTKYYWRVYGKNSGGSGPFSPARDFTTIVAAPGATTLAAPPDGAQSQLTSLPLVWRKTTGATVYRVQVATDSTFAGGIVVNDSTVTDTTKAIGGLQFNVRYFWRVSARNIGGSGPYSATWSFRTLTQDPSVPVQLAPLNGSTGLSTSLALRWTRPAGATSFHLQFGIDSSFATTIIDEPAATDTSRNLTGLAYLTKYYWRINADNVGGTSPWSSAWSFTTGVPLPAQVTLVGPAHLAQIGADSVRLTWRKSTPLVTRYWVQLGVDSLFAFSVIDSTVTDSTKVSKGLLNNTWYFWRIRAANPGGWGPYSEIRKFRVTITSIAANQEVPTEFGLKQNYPNPFNPSTEIAFALPQESRVQLEVYSLIGQRVASLIDEQRPAGYYTVRFDATDLPSGIYLYRLVAGEKVFTRKMMLLK